MRGYNVPMKLSLICAGLLSAVSLALASCGDNGKVLRVSNELGDEFILRVVSIDDFKNSDNDKRVTEKMKSLKRTIVETGNGKKELDYYALGYDLSSKLKRVTVEYDYVRDGKKTTIQNEHWIDGNYEGTNYSFNCVPTSKKEKYSTIIESLGVSTAGNPFGMSQFEMPYSIRYKEYVRDQFADLNIQACQKFVFSSEG